MLNGSYAETKSTISDQKPASGAVSSIVVDLGYEIFSSPYRSFLFKTQIPVLGDGKQLLQTASVGINFWIWGLSSLGLFEGNSDSIRFNSGLRAFVGPVFGVGYLVYSTTTTKRGDIFFDIGGQAGVVYSLTERYGLYGQAAVSRGIGVATGTLTMKFMVGGNTTF